MALGKPLRKRVWHRKTLVFAASSNERHRNTRSECVKHDPYENRGPIETKAKLPPKILQAAGILEPHRTEHSFKSVGGLDALKRWLTLRRAAFFYKGPERVPPPRGILLFGPPGCGKSLIVTATANEWAVPLFRLDFGKIFGSYVGQSEENMRAAFSLAQSSAPCILWVDEVDLRLAAAGRDRPVDPIVIRMINMLLLWFAEATSFHDRHGK